MIATLSEKLGSAEAAAEALLKKYGEREIPFVPFGGDRKAEILSLQQGAGGTCVPVVCAHRELEDPCPRTRQSARRAAGVDEGTDS